MISQLLADSADSYTGKKFMEQLLEFVQYLAAAVSAGLILYAVYIGYLFATASDANKRKAAKDRLVKAVASCLIIIGLTYVLVVVGQNLSFSKVERGNLNIKYSKYIYQGTPSFSFDDFQSIAAGTGVQVTGTVSILPSGICGFDDNVPKSLVEHENEIILKECRIAKELSNWSGGGRSVTNIKDTPGIFAFKFSFTEGGSKNIINIPVKHVTGNEQRVYIPIEVDFVFVSDNDQEVQTVSISTNPESRDPMHIKFQ